MRHPLSARGRAISTVAGLAILGSTVGALYAFGLPPFNSSSFRATMPLKPPESLSVAEDGEVELNHRDDRFAVNGKANAIVEDDNGVWVSGGKLDDEDGEVYFGRGLAGRWEPNSTKHLGWNGQVYHTDENTFLGQRVIVPGDWVQRTLDVHNVSQCPGTVTVYVGLDHYLHEQFAFFGPWRVNSDDPTEHGLVAWENSVPGGPDLSEHVELFWNLKQVDQCLDPWQADPLLTDPHAWSDTGVLAEHAERPATATRPCTVVPVVDGENPRECPGQWPVSAQTLLADPAQPAVFTAAADTLSCAVPLENIVDEAVRLEIEANPLLQDAEKLDLYRTRLLYGLTVATDSALDDETFSQLNNLTLPMGSQTWQRLVTLSADHGIPMHGWAGIVAEVNARNGSKIDIATNIPLVPIGQVYLPADSVQPVTFGKRVDLMLDHHNSEYDESGSVVHDDSVLAFDLYVELECDTAQPGPGGPTVVNPNAPQNPAGEGHGEAPSALEAAPLTPGQQIFRGSLSKTGVSLIALLAALLVLAGAALARRRHANQDQLIAQAVTSQDSADGGDAQ